MNGRLLTLARVLKRVLSLAAGISVLLLLAGSLTVYLTVTNKSLSLLRLSTAKIGQLLSGQRTEQLTLDVRVSPSDGRLTGTATLTVRSLEDDRRRFYFLLNDRLRIRALRGADGGAAPAEVPARSPGSAPARTFAQAPAAYQFSLLTIVDAGRPIAKGSTVQLTFDYGGQPAGGMFGAAQNVVNPQQVLLNVDSFWYPTDVQSFFTADVTVTLPSDLTLVHNGAHATRAERGNVQQIRWTSERPVAGLALVAGAYEMTTREADGLTYQLYLAKNLQLDAGRILASMNDANRVLTERYGPSGFKQLTLFVNDASRRGFNDGSGLMGLSIRYFRGGDYGFGPIAHELAHNWWGGTVAEKWLSPGTGGEWLVEGFAEFSSLVATEAIYGADALTRRLTGEFFDPARQATIADMSVLDNALSEPLARDTIYRKGAYVAFMLRRMLGDDVYFRALRQLLERFQYQQAGDRDVQQVLQEISQQNLDRYFADWVRSDHLADLSLDASNQAEITVNNLGSAVIPGDIDLWTFKKGGGEPHRTTVHIGDHLSWDADTDYAVLDPQLMWADVQRENNRYPRRNDPVYISAAHGRLALSHGEVFPWVRATVSSSDSDGRIEHTWDFNRGLTDPPSWASDGARLVTGYSDPTNPLSSIVTLAADGARRSVGFATAPAAGANGTIYAAQTDRIVRFAADGTASTVIRRRGEALDRPFPSTDGSQLAYTAARANHLELRVVGVDGRGDRLLMSWDNDRLLYRWSSDATRLYAVVGGTWDWQVWEIPLGTNGTRVLARAAAAISDLAVSPDGSQLAFAAAPSLDYPMNRCQLYVVHLRDREVRTFDIPGSDIDRLAWVDTDTLVLVATAQAAGQPRIFPPVRDLKRVRLADGSVEDVR